MAIFQPGIEHLIEERERKRTELVTPGDADKDWDVDLDSGVATRGGTEPGVATRGGTEPGTVPATEPRPADRVDSGRPDAGDDGRP
jgi:hypothetical protein